MISSTLIKSVQDIMRQDQGVDGDAQRLSQLVWMIFLKILDDTERELELMTDGYESAVPAKYQWRYWAGDEEGLTGDDLNNFVNNDLFPALRKLPAGVNPRTLIVREAFEDSYNYMKSGTLLRQVINRINSIDFTIRAHRYQFNDLYEKLLKDLQSAGNAGEYYTPRALTQFIVEMVDPKLGEIVLDPACGTGGFLANTIDHLRKQVKTGDEETLLQSSLRGIEKKQLPHLLCLTNMILHGVDAPTAIRRANTLTRPLRDYGPADRVDVIVTNPPFGGIEEPGVEQNFPQKVRTRETADLFLVLIMRLLKPGGRAGVVLPHGTLFGEGVKTRIKEQLLEECNLHTVVRIPNSAFAPYANIATNLLFFAKGEPTREIWFYEHPLPRALKSYSKSNPMRSEEFDEERAWWGERKESERSWRVGIEQIRERNFNLAVNNPNSNLGQRESLAELLADYRHKQREAAHTIDAIRDLLNQALKTCERRIVDVDELRLMVERLDEVARIPGGVERMRDAVVELALTGHLVESEPGDEAVDDLIARIASEKQTLGLKGGVRALETDKSLALPDSWRLVSLGDILAHCRNGTSAKPNDVGAGYPLLRISAATSRRDGVVDLSDHKFTELSESQAASYFVRPGDLLACRFNGNLHYVGRVSQVPPVANGPILHPDKLICLRAILVSHAYLRHVMNSKFVRRQIESVAATTAGNIGINGKQVKALTVPLAPLLEQGRIAKRLDEAFALLDRLSLFVA
ncbi:N-6 DNA methylase [Streptomyces sp. NPDC002276]